MSWSRFGSFGGLLAVVFSMLGVAATISNPGVASPVALAVGGLVAAGLVLGSDAALGVAVTAAGIGYAIGGVRGTSGATWAVIAALIAVAGARICFESRRPARIAIGAHRALAIGLLAVVGAVLWAVVLLTALDGTHFGRGWAIAGVALCAGPLFLVALLNRHGMGTVPRFVRLVGGAGVAVLVSLGVVGGALATERQRAIEDSSDIVEVADDTGESSEVVQRNNTAEPEQPPPVGEWVAAIISTIVVLIVLGLLASNWFREQPLEFKPADAVPGDGGGMITDSTVEDPLAMLVSTEAAAGVFDRALVAIDEVEDPRQAIRLAYSLVEEGFGDLDVQRGPSESEHEYLTRLLPRLGVSASAMTELTSLFEVARFSAHTMTDSMREEAVNALNAVRGDLIAQRGEVPS